MRKLTSTLSIFITLLPIIASLFIAKDNGASLVSIGAITMGITFSFIFFLFGVTFTPLLMPEKLWSKIAERDSIIYRFNAAFILPLSTMSSSATLTVAALEPQLLTNSLKRTAPFLGLVGIIGLIQSIYKLCTDHSCHFELRIEKTGLTIGSRDYSYFNAENLESVKPSGKTALFPRIEINGDGIQTSGSWRPGRPKVKSIHRQTLGGMSLGHWGPHEISHEIYQRVEL